jgi:hypothetical protein
MSAVVRRHAVLRPSLWLGVVVLTLLVPRHATAQVLYGSIVGDVKDASGAVVPGAVVVVTNKGTSLTRQRVTDGAGHFTLADLPAGVYGFKASCAPV